VRRFRTETDDHRPHALQGFAECPFTVFAPTNEAFAQLPKGTVENLLKPENKDKLVKILTYHVVSADAMANTIKKRSRTMAASTPSPPCPAVSSSP
jgi:uncharacterized surface protein with fasciclin (FAS1) repeats